MVLAGVPWSCSKKPPPLTPDSAASDNPEVEKQFRQARDLFERGKNGAADPRFAKLAKAHPKDPLARVSLIYRARIYLSKGDPGRARDILEPIIGDSDPVAERAAFYDGVALYRLKQYTAAVERLAPFAQRLTDPKENLLLLETLWKAALAAGNDRQAIVWLDSYLSQVSKGEDRKNAQDALKELSTQLEKVEELKDLKNTLDPQGDTWPIVMARLARLHFDAEKFKAAARVLREVDRHDRSNVKEVEAVAALIEQRVTVDLGSVGCIVPLSGRSRLIGETVLKGVMLGARNVRLGDSAESRHISVIIRDSKGSPIQAKEAVEELVFKEHVSAIVGPLNKTAAKIAAIRAEELGVPMLALSVRDDLPEIGKFVFREFATHSADVQALIAAAKQIGSRQLAVFYPDTGYGRTMRGFFEAEVAKQGLDYGGEVSYPQKATDFVEQTTELLEIDFDTLFLAGSSGRIALLAPALAAAGLWSTPMGEEPGGPGKAIQIIVPSTGLAPDLIRRAGRYLEGALFTTFFYTQSTPETSDFVERFQSDYGSQPNYLSGFGHDAVVLVAGALRDGARDRDGVRRWLTESDETTSDSLPLVTPFAGFETSGEPRAKPWVLRLISGEVEVLR